MLPFGFHVSTVKAKRALSIRPQPLQTLRLDSINFHFPGFFVKGQSATRGVPKVALLLLKNKSKSEAGGFNPHLQSTSDGHLAYKYSMFRDALSAHREGLRLRYMGRSPSVEFQHVAIEKSFHLTPKWDFWDTGVIHAATLFGLSVQTGFQPLCRVAVGISYQPIRRTWCIVEEVDAKWTHDEWFTNGNWNGYFTGSGEHGQESGRLHVQNHATGLDCHVSVKLTKDTAALEDDLLTYVVHMTIEHKT